jgi:hypothetical protein
MLQVEAQLVDCDHFVESHHTRNTRLRILKRRTLLLFHLIRIERLPRDWETAKCEGGVLPASLPTFGRSNVAQKHVDFHKGAFGQSA